MSDASSSHSEWFVELLSRIQPVWESREEHAPGTAIILDKETWRRARCEMSRVYDLDNGETWYYPMLYQGVAVRWSVHANEGEIRWEIPEDFANERRAHARGRTS